MTDHAMPDQFVTRHIGADEASQSTMLSAIAAAASRDWSSV